MSDEEWMKRACLSAEAAVRSDVDVDSDSKCVDICSHASINMFLCTFSTRERDYQCPQNWLQRRILCF